MRSLVTSFNKDTMMMVVMMVNVGQNTAELNYGAPKNGPRPFWGPFADCMCVILHIVER